MRNCSTCALWKATELEVYIPDGLPAEAVRALQTNAEVLRATWALCTWPETEEAQRLMAVAPWWVRQSPTNGGMMTNEEHGLNCAGWRERPPIDFG